MTNMEHMARKKFSAAAIVLLVLSFLRFAANAVAFALTSQPSSLVVAAVYLVAFWGIYKSRRWGYMLVAAYSIIDIGLVAILGGKLASGFNFGAVLVDLVILILAVMEIQKIKK